jgi:patatin-related protein
MGGHKDVTPATQEIRFATAMTGGVSLAIWMGGVARELNLLDQASRRREAGADDPDEEKGPDGHLVTLYRGLLDLLDQVVRIDVLSGTSAGGINAAVLGLCHTTGWDLGWLRDVWLTAGDIGELLRDPAKDKPTSLLRGDGVLLKQLEDNLGREREAVFEADRSTTVHITTTLLDGETSSSTDDYGSRVPDVDHLGIFRFTQDQLREAKGRRALALAARASASFPGAFEPAFVRIGGPDDNGAGDSTTRPKMDEYLPATRSHWAADGGLLANRPIRPILDTIFERPAEDKQVRRVLLYVVPDPGGNPSRPTDPPREQAELDQPLSLLSALGRDLGAALNQSIAADLTAIRDHNDRVDAMRDSRLRLAQLGIRLRGGDETAEPYPTDEAWSDYKALQGRMQVEPAVSALMRRISTMPPEQIPSAWKHELDNTTDLVEPACAQAASSRLTGAWDRPHRGSTAGELAGLGRPAYEAVRGMAVSLTFLGYACLPRPELRESLAKLGQSFYSVDPPQADGCLNDIASTALATAGPTGAMPLTEVATTIVLDHVAALAGVAGPPGGPTSAGQDGSALAGAWRQLARALADLQPILDEIVVTPLPEDTKPRIAQDKLRTYLDYLGDDQDAWLSRLVGLHIMDRSLLPVGMDVDQKVQLIQVSAATRSLLDPARETPESKLTGLQFHHFGAFYKRSWRANDWMWGRVDGAGWLVQALLDPKRVKAIVDDSQPDPGLTRAQQFLEQLRTLVGAPKDAEFKRLSAKPGELGYLDDGRDPPASLPETARWVARSWQRRVVQNELPVVASEALATPTNKRQTWALDVLKEAGQADQAVAAARLATAQVSSGRRARMTRDEAKQAPVGGPAPEPDGMVALLPSCPIPDETLGQERGEPLFTRTAAKLIAVATAALTAVDQAPVTVGALFRTARTVTLTGYRAANTVGFVPRRLVLAGTVLVAAGVVLASQGSTLFGITGLVGALAGIYLVCFGVWSWSSRALEALVASTVVLGVFALTTPVVREHLYGTGDDTEAGWVTDTVVPWLRDTWWAPLVILAVLVVVPVVATLVTRRVVPRASARKRPASGNGWSAADGERGRGGGRRSRPNPERTLNVTVRTVQPGGGRGAPGEEPGERRGLEKPPAR